MSRPRFVLAVTVATVSALTGLPSHAAGGSVGGIGLVSEATEPAPGVVHETAVAALGGHAVSADSTAWSPEGERPTGLLLVGLGAFVAVAAALAAALARWRPGHRELEAMAGTDALPGVANRRRLDGDLVAAAHRIVLPDGDHVTVSIGIADTDGRDLGEAVEAGDRALDAVEDQGRDRVVAAPPSDRLLTSS